MKKAISLFALFILFCGLWGCGTAASSGEVADTTSVPLPYSYTCVKCTDNLTENASDAITVIRSVEELAQYKQSCAAFFDLEKEIQAESAITLTQTFDVYDADYFEAKTLVIVRRNFVTNNELVLLDGTSDNSKNAVIQARFDASGAYEKSVRFFLIQLQSEYFPQDATLSLEISEAESTTVLSDVAMLIAKGDTNYKTVYATEQIKEILETIDSFSCKKAENTLEDYNPASTDITISYQRFVAIFSDEFLYIDGVFYEPDSAVKQRMVEIYNSLDEKAEQVTDDLNEAQDAG